MNHNFKRIFLLCVWLSIGFSSNLWAQAWSLEPEIAQPKIHASALAIHEKVESIPDPLFMAAKDQKLVNELLAETITHIDVSKEQFAFVLKRTYSHTDKEAWFEAQELYLTLKNLSQSKQELLKLATQQTRHQLTSFGSYGVTQFKTELELTSLNAQYLAYYQLQSFKDVIQHIKISPVPLLVAVIKIMFVLWIMGWWLRQSPLIIKEFRKNHFIGGKQPRRFAKFIWYISQANKQISWLIGITLCLKILAGLPSLGHLHLLDIFIWWVLGGSIAVSLLLEFVYRNSRKTNPELTKLRLSTIRYYVWSIIITGVTLHLARITIGEGTIYHWILKLLFLWFALITIIVLSKWKEYIFNVEEPKDEAFPVWAKWAISHKNTLGLSSVATIVMATYRALRHLKFLVISTLSHYAFFRQLLAYLFRIEVAKQSDNSTSNHLVPLEEDQLYQYVLPGSEDSALINYADQEIEQLSHYLLGDSPALCVVSGERGVGTTTVLRRMINQAEQEEHLTPIYLNCPNGGYKELMSEFAVNIGLAPESTDIQILSYLRKHDECYFVAIDNCQRLIKPKVGGLNELLKLTNLIRRSKRNHRALLAIEKSSWRFVDRARGERLLFDLVKFLPQWNDNEINELFETRLTKKYPVCFEGLSIPKQWDQDEMSEEERTRQGFYKILWHYADGNPTVALRFFRLSLRLNTQTQHVVVRLFNAPQSEELDTMPKPMLAILRSIVQLEVSTPEELAECTQLRLAEIIGSLRFFQSRGYIEWNDDKARISDHWYRYITNALHRQHLLVK